MEQVSRKKQHPEARNPKETGYKVSSSCKLKFLSRTQSVELHLSPDVGPSGESLNIIHLRAESLLYSKDYFGSTFMNIKHKVPDMIHFSIGEDKTISK